MIASQLTWNVDVIRLVALAAIIGIAIWLAIEDKKTK